jgi:exopolyphosphatase/guanosine-5'-triphosphate,3'-diphosphate pyrophosphatase
LEARRKTPGLNPGRADIIIAGGAILQTFVEELGLPYVHITDRGLRDGLLVDYLVKHGYAPLLENMSVRRHSVLQLGRACQFNERHAETTARLALALFDSASEARLHAFGAWERELLEYAALLHHIGAFLTYSNYQAHTYYLIRNANLLGFDQTEVELIATVALYHRKAMPRKKHPEFAALNKSARPMVRTLSALLRLAENLDRSQAGYVCHAALQAVSPKHVVLQVRSKHDCQIELWGVQKETEVFAKAFERHLKIKVLEPAGGTSPPTFA